MLRKIKDLWKLKSSIHLIAIDNDYFLVKFSSLDDYNYAKFEGPCLPIEYFDHVFFMKLGSKIGRLVKIDDARAPLHEDTARLCVKVDLSKPLVSKFLLRRKVR